MIVTTKDQFTVADLDRDVMKLIGVAFEAGCLTLPEIFALGMDQACEGNWEDWEVLVSRLEQMAGSGYSDTIKEQSGTLNDQDKVSLMSRRKMRSHIADFWQAKHEAIAERSFD